MFLRAVTGALAGFVATLGIAACADLTSLPDAGQDAATVDLKDLASIRIDPADAVLEITDDKPVKQTYKVFGKFKDGAERDITDSTTFSVPDPWVGVFDNNTFTSAADHGGRTTVRAEAAGVSAETSLTIVHKKTIVTEGFPAEAVKAFDKMPETGIGPMIAYPPDGVLLPPNLLELEFQWRPAESQPYFELSLSNEETSLRIFTKCNVVGSGCGFQPAPAVWQTIVTTFKGKDTTTIKVRALDGAMTKVGTSEPRLLMIAQEDILGGLYYWNATPGSIIRYDFGQPSPKAKEFYNAAQAKAMFCVGCHALSRNGERMAVGLDMPAPSPLKILDVSTRDELSSGAANFMAFSPDGGKIITSDGKTMALADGTTLAPIAPNPLPTEGTMPDWSPDGAFVIYVEPQQTLPMPFGTPGIDSGALKLLKYDAAADTWQGPRTLVEFQGQNNYYPTFSPDNQLVVFNRASGNSYDAPDASLWLVRADGNGKPVALTLANDAEGNPGQYCNSWPKFAPFVQTYKGRRLMWLTFSSRRDYGLRLAGTNQAQLWMVAIDPSKAELSADPSYPAFWLPFQDIKTGNHIAQWTEKVIRKPCTPEGNCPPGEFCENGFCEPRTEID